LDFQLPLHIEGEAWAIARDGLAANGFFIPTSGKRAAAKYRRLLTETTAAEDFRKNAGLSLESLQCITQPTIAVYGSVSPYLPTRDGLLREIPDCRSETIADAGHNVPFLMPEKTAEVIARFWPACRSARVAS
jgi:pimeloyl-ACP methyl ester carboxylesterase